MSSGDPPGAGGHAGLGLPVMRHRRSLREDIAHALRAAIIAGRLRPDVLYSAPTLASEFGVSPTPVREAILDLAKEDLVTIAKNKGFRVNSITDEKPDEITQIRELLEVPTVAGLAGRLTDEQLGDLQSTASSRRHKGQTSSLHRGRHGVPPLLDLAGNTRLTALVADLRNAQSAGAQSRDGVQPAEPRPVLSHRGAVSYTNNWGTAFASLVPCVIAYVSSVRSGVLRVALLVSLPIAAVPAFLTLNRGMFIGLGGGHGVSWPAIASAR